MGAHPFHLAAADLQSGRLQAVSVGRPFCDPSVFCPSNGKAADRKPGGLRYVRRAQARPNRRRSKSTKISRLVATNSREEGSGTVGVCGTFGMFGLNSNW